MANQSPFREAMEEVRSELQGFRRDAQKARPRRVNTIDRRRARSGDPVVDILKQIGMQAQDFTE